MAESAKTINSRLLRLHGYDKETNVQKFRVVRSETQTEPRGGDYNVFCGPIFLRRECGVREVKKYWNIPACWVLERVEPNVERYTLIPKKFTYEPFFTFLTQDNKPLPLAWKAIEFAIGMMTKMEKRFKTEQDHLNDEEKRMSEEQNVIRGKLDEPDPIVKGPTQYKSSVGLRGKEVLENATLTRKLNKDAEQRIINSIMHKKAPEFNVTT